MLRPLQALPIVLVFFQAYILAAACAAARAEGAPANQELAAECEALLRQMVQKPYGWAIASHDVVDQVLPRNSALVSIKPLSTPAATLLLYQSGKELNDPRYVNSARQLARGMMASQQSNGRFPAMALFANNVSARDAVSALPSRAPTYAAMSALLTLAQNFPEDERLRRACTRGALWLTKQQTPAGAWPSLVVTHNGESERAIRLDDQDYRNGTLALLYAYDVLQDAMLRRSMEKSIEQLLRMQIASTHTAKGLWRTIYDLDGTASDLMPDYERAADILATRYCLQTLLVTQAAVGVEGADAALSTSANTLKLLKSAENQWRRLYPLKGNDLRYKPGAPITDDAANPFAVPSSLERQLHITHSFALPPVLSAIERLQSAGRQRYQSPTAPMNHRQEIALTLAGLWDMPLCQTLPQTPGAAKAWLGSEGWHDLETQSQDDVEARVQRINLMLIRMKMQRLANQPEPAAKGEAATTQATSQPIEKVEKKPTEDGGLFNRIGD